MFKIMYKGRLSNNRLIIGMLSCQLILDYKVFKKN